MTIDHPEHKRWRAVNMRPRVGTSPEEMAGELMAAHTRMVRHIEDSRDAVKPRYLALMKRCALALLIDAREVSSERQWQ